MKKTNFDHMVTIVATVTTIFLQVAFCDVEVEMNPEWVNYGQTSTITMKFDIPCPKYNIFRQGPENSTETEMCVFGETCKVDPSKIGNKIKITANPDGTGLSVIAPNALANGVYHGVCLTRNATCEGVIAVGVKPRIIVIEYGSPDNNGTVIRLTRWQNDRKMAWNSSENDPNAETVFKPDEPLQPPGNDTYVTFIVGMGVDPSEMTPQDVAPKNFKFEVPDLDANEEMPRERLANYAPLPDYPLATSFRYRLDRSAVVKEGKCQLKFDAIATLISDQIDKATVQLDFNYDPLLSTVTVKKTEGKKCDCLFTCEVASCPAMEAPYDDYEWSFANVSLVSWKNNSDDEASLQQNVISRNKLQKGNVAGFPQQFLLNADECSELFHASRVIAPVTVKCHSESASSCSEVDFYDLMDDNFFDGCETDD